MDTKPSSFLLSLAPNPAGVSTGNTMKDMFDPQVAARAASQSQHLDLSIDTLAHVSAFANSIPPTATLSFANMFPKFLFVNQHLNGFYPYLSVDRAGETVIFLEVIMISLIDTERRLVPHEAGSSSWDQRSGNNEPKPTGCFPWRPRQ